MNAGRVEGQIEGRKEGPIEYRKEWTEEAKRFVGGKKVTSGKEEGKKERGRRVGCKRPTFLAM